MLGESGSRRIRRAAWITLLVTLFAGSGQPVLSAPDGDTFEPLFVIGRSVNTNVVHYEARVSPQGRLVPSEPVVVYWRMHAQDGRREPLNSIERSRIYGVKSTPLEDGKSFRVVIAAEPNRDIRVFMEDRIPRAETLIGGKRAYLDRLFVSVARFNPFHINYIESFGVDMKTGENVRERWAR